MRTAIIRVLRKEPAAITGVISAVIGVGLAFGALDWSGDQAGLVMVAVGALMVLVRQLVTPVAD